VVFNKIIMNPKQTYLQSLTKKQPFPWKMTGQQSGQMTPYQPKQNVQWGMPSSGASYTPNMGTANSTPGVSSNVNSSNPTASYMTPSTPGATATTPVKTTPVSTTTSQTATLPPSGKTYAQQLADAMSGVKNVQSSYNSLKEAQKTDSSKENESEYLKYLRSMFNPEEMKIQAQRESEARQRLADVQNQYQAAELDSRRRYENILDTPGGLKSGTQAGATLDRRRSNQELADIALQEQAAARSAQVAQTTYENYLNAGKSMYEAEQAAQQAALDVAEDFTLSEGQARYDASGNLIASRGKTYALGTGGGSGGSGFNVSDAARNIIEQINLGANLDDLIKGNSNAAQSLRNEVLAGLNQQGGLTTRARELFQEAKNAVDSLLTQGGYQALGGYSSRLGGQYTTAYGDAQARAQQLEAILARDNLGLLKGAMSDKDLAFIQSMSSGFKGEGIQSEEFIKGRLEEIQTKLSNKLGASAETGQTSQPSQMRLPNGTIVYLQADGTNSE